MRLKECLAREKLHQHTPDGPHIAWIRPPQPCNGNGKVNDRLGTPTQGLNLPKMISGAR